MELLDLAQPDGVKRAGVYVLDDDGALVLAGPFPDEKAAVIWIERTGAERQAKSDRNS